VVPA
jgi:hypothetical protein